jgi:hypothetical protein
LEVRRGIAALVFPFAFLFFVRPRNKEKQKETKAARHRRTPKKAKPAIPQLWHTACVTGSRPRNKNQQ